MPVVARLNQYGSLLATEFDETTANALGVNTSGVFYAGDFDENIAIATKLSANVFPPYDIVFDEFAGVSYGPGQGTFMRQYTDKSMAIYNELDEVTSIT